MPAKPSRRKPKLAASVCDSLRAALVEAQDAGVSRYRLAKDSGVGADLIARFQRGEKDLSGRSVDRLARVLGLRLVRVKPEPPGR